jgi:hypothetical protein
VVKEKANEIALKMQIEFQCSNGWLQLFKKRYNITWQAISGESPAVDVEASDKWRENVVPIIEQCAPQDFLTWMKRQCFIMYNRRERWI